MKQSLSNSIDISKPSRRSTCMSFNQKGKYDWDDIFDFVNENSLEGNFQPYLHQYFITTKPNLLFTRSWDFRFIKIKQIFIKNIEKKKSSYTSHFGLGYIHLHEQNYDEATYLFHECLGYCQQQSSQSFYALKFMCLSIILKHLAFPLEESQRLDRSCSLFSVLSKFSYDNIKSFFTGQYEGDYKSFEIKWCYQALKKLVSFSSDNVDYLWLLMVFCYQFKDKYEIVLTEDIDDYMYKIKQANPYFGYLAYCNIINLGYISLQKNGPNLKAKLILQDLIKTKEEKYEAYVMLWNYFYTQPLKHLNNQQKDLYLAKNIIKRFEPLLKKSILFSLIYAKSLRKYEQKEKLFEYLYNKAQNHPTQTIYLYMIGKYICKDKVNNPHELLQAEDALQECLRRSDEVFHNQIKYYLGKIQQIQQEYFNQYIIWNEISTIKHKPKYISEVKSFLHTHRDKAYLINVYKLMSNKYKNLEISKKLYLRQDSISELSQKMLELFIFYQVNLSTIEQRLLEERKNKPEQLNIGILLYRLYEQQGNQDQQQQIIEELYQDLERFPTNQSTIFEVSKIYAKMLFKAKQFQHAINILHNLSQIFCKIDFSLPIEFNKDQMKDQEQLNIFKRKSSINKNFNSNNNLDDSYGKRYSSHNENAVQKAKIIDREFKMSQMEQENPTFSNIHGTLEYVNKENLYLKSPMKPRLKTDEFEDAIQSIKDSICFIKNGNLARSDSTSFQDQGVNDKIFTDTNFLYLIAKFTQKCNQRCQEGLEAINYVIDKMMYQNQHKNELQYVTRMVKAKYRKGILLLQLNNIVEGMVLLRSILVDLHQLDMKKKLKKAQVQILIYRSQRK